MSIAYRDSLVTDITVATRSPVVNKPSGVQDGDLMLMFLNTNTNSDTSTPIASWTRIGTEVDAGTDTTGAVYYKIASSEGSSWTMTNLFAATEIGRFFVIAYSGVDGTTPIHKNTSRYQDSSSTDLSATSFTTTIDGCMIIHSAQCDPTGTSPYSVTQDTDPATTERIDAADSNNDAHCFVQDWLQTSQGAIALNATASQSDNWAIFQIALAPLVTSARRARISWAELEVPNAVRRAQVSWTELEVPNAVRRAQISWAELEVPNAVRRAQISWAELEVPTFVSIRRAQISWSELEVPDAVSRRAQVSWVELEVPNAPRRAQLSWAEFEVPNAVRRARISWAELEVPNALRRAQLSWVEFEIPDLTARRARVSFTEFEVPDFVLRRAQVSWVEIEVPDLGGPGEVRKIKVYRNFIHFH